MANPQTENGHTRIANEILDALCKIRIPGEARQILDCIIRKTYGFNKKSDGIPLAQFEEMTGIKRPNIIRSLNKLEEMNLIHVIKKDNATEKSVYNSWNVYEFIKDFDKWKPLPKKVTALKREKSLSKKIITVIEKDNLPLSKKIHSKDNVSKDNKKENKKEKDFVLPDWVPIDAWNGYMEVRKKNKYPLTTRAMNLLIGKLEKFRAKGYDIEAIIDESTTRGWSSVFAGDDDSGKKTNKSRRQYSLKL